MPSTQPAGEPAREPAGSEIADPGQERLTCASCGTPRFLLVESIELMPEPSTEVYIASICLNCDSSYGTVLERGETASLLLNGAPLTDLGHATLMHCGEAMTLSGSPTADASLMRCRCGFVVEVPIHRPFSAR